MPRGDRTGPAGMGPMTGRAAGYCAGYGMPGYANPYGGRMGGGFGRGRGWGRGWGYAPGPGSWGAPYAPPPYGSPPYYGAYSAEQEKQALHSQLKFFEEQIGALKQRIDELDGEAEQDKD